VFDSRTDLGVLGVLIAHMCSSIRFGKSTPPKTHQVIVRIIATGPSSLYPTSDTPNTIHPTDLGVLGVRSCASRRFWRLFKSPTFKAKPQRFDSNLVRLMACLIVRLIVCLIVRLIERLKVRSIVPYIRNHSQYSQHTWGCSACVGVPPGGSGGSLSLQLPLAPAAKCPGWDVGFDGV
jgi:hypothetical protein